MPTLRFVGRPFDGFEQALERQVASFEVHHDVSLDLERDHRPLPEIHAGAVETGAIADGTYDLFLCLSDWLPGLADEGLLTPIDDYLADDPPDDWPEGGPRACGRSSPTRTRPTRSPYHDGPEVFHYRRDLFESVDEQRAFREVYGRPLHVPKTWDEFRDVAEFFTRPEEGLWGTVVAALPDGHNDVYDFLIQLWSRGGEVLDAEGNPAFDGEAGREALQFYHDLIHEHEVVPPEATAMESLEAEAVLRGRPRRDDVELGGFGSMAEDPDSAVFGDVNYGLIPEPTLPGVGTRRSPSSTASRSQPGASMRISPTRFLRHAANADNDKVTTTAGASGTRFSTWRDPTCSGRTPSTPSQREVNTSSVNTLPQIPAYVELNEILDEMVAAAVVDRSKSVDEALADAAAAADVVLN